MDLSKINHSKSTYSGAAGTATVNHYTGRLTFEHGDVTIGTGPFAFGVSHIYNSYAGTEHAPPDYSIRMGSKWKLSIQHYIFQNGTQNSYTYVDGFGHRHQMEYLQTTSGKAEYYDTAGSGLSLLITGGSLEGAVITDNTDIGYRRANTIVFNAKGAATNIKSSNDYLDLFLSHDYSGTELMEASFGSMSSRNEVLQLKYYESGANIGLLSSIIVSAQIVSSLYESKRINYFYDAAGNLTSITESAAGQQRTVASFEYDTAGNLVLAKGPDASGAVSFAYTGGMVTEVAGKYKQSYMPATGGGIFASASIFSGAGEYATASGTPAITGYEELNAKAHFYYSSYIDVSNKTTVTNHNNLSFVYSLNHLGQAVAVYEEIGSSVSAIAPSPDTGKRLQSGNGSYGYFNGAPISGAQSYPSGSTQLSGTFLTQKVKDEINKNKEINRAFTFSIWIKLTAVQTGSAPQFKVAFGGAFGECTAPIDISKINVWQIVSFEKCFYANQSYSNTCAFYIQNDGTPCTLQFADPRITYNTSRAILRQTATASALTYDIRDMGTVTVTSTPSTAPITLFDQRFAASNQNYVTAADIEQTLFNKAKAGGGSFIFVCNGGRRKIAGVSSVVFTVRNATDTFALQSNANSETGIPTYFVDTTLAENTSIKQFTAYSSGQIYVYAQAVKGSVATNTLQRYDGGLLRESRDEYGVWTSYTYDSYGNLLQTKVTAPGTTESIVTSATYEENEFLKSSTGNRVTTTYDQRSPYGNFESVTDGNGLKTKFTYTAFGDAPKDISFLTGTTEHLKHTLDNDPQGNLQKLTHNSGWNYEIAESNYGRTVKEKINGQEVVSRTVSQYGDTVTTVYGNALTVVDTYDKYGRLWISTSSDSSGFVSSITNTYSDYGNTAQNTSAAKLRKTVEKHIEGEYTKEYTYLYSYDADEQQMLGGTYTVRKVGGAEELNNTVVRDENNPAKYYQYFNDMIKTIYLVNDPDKLIAPRRTSVITQTYTDDPFSTDYIYDRLGRIETITQTGFAWSSNLVTTYTYKTGTTQIANEYSSSPNLNLSFDLTYDPNGNILSYGSENYLYNDLGALKQVSSDFAGTQTYTYDSRGNIQSKDGVTFGYDAQNRLISGGGTYSYNSLGSPTVYKGKKLKWSGRQLTEFDTDGNKVTYQYDANGLLTQKTSGGITKSFFRNGTQIIGEKWSGAESRVIEYYHDLTGVCGMKYGAKKYIFQKNIFGDVSRVYLLNGTSLFHVASYSYDAWGKCTTDYYGNGDEYADATDANPFRYRGYYYDTGSKLYYLQSRYYDPSTGRFISADPTEYLDPFNSVGLNLYAYCGNNPIKYYDPSGNFPILITLILLMGLVAGGVIGGAIAYNRAIDAGETESDLFWATVGGVFIGGLIGLAAAGLFIAAWAGIVGGIAVINGTTLTAVTVFGISAKQAFVIGLLISNASAMIVGPLVGIKFQTVRPAGKPQEVPEPLPPYYPQDWMKP